MSQWTKYDGDYSKQYYDVKTTNGVVYEQCYPSCGIFHALNGIEVPEHEIEFIKKAKAPNHE